MPQEPLEHDWYPRLLPDNVSIGPRSWLYSAFAFLHCRSRQPWAVRIGSDTGVYNGTFFDLGPEGQVDVGDYCTLVGAIICTNNRLTIGDYTFIAHEVVIADTPFATPNQHVARASRPRSASLSASEAPVPQASGIAIGPNAWIAARAVILAGATIGQGAIIGAAAVVDFPVPPYAIVAGNPASVVGWANKAKGPVPPTGPQGR